MQTSSSTTLEKQGPPTPTPTPTSSSTSATQAKRARMTPPPPPPPPPPSLPPTIHLTEHEAQLFDLLRQATLQAGTGTTLRVAGGWVRDKLLGRESDDIDMALDNVSGTQFAESLNSFLQSQGLETRSIGVIQANPDQSKHLETARVLVLGQWIDFTNLRTETYQADSRIPEISFGTAEEDAYRRDITVNALFYNLLTGEVEDFTGKGLIDLLGGKGEDGDDDDVRDGEKGGGKSGIGKIGKVIRTPLPALTTFLDDPLRLLRAIRFSARFALPLDGEIVQAARDEGLKEALHEKVSRERVGIEVEGMLSGKDARPAVALEMVVELGLAEVVFCLPKEVQAVVRGPEREGGGGGEGGDVGVSVSVGVLPEGWEKVGLATVRMANVLLMEREVPGSVEGALSGVGGEKEKEKKKEDGTAAAATTTFETLVRESPAYQRPRREHRLLFLSAMLRAWAGYHTLNERKTKDQRVEIVHWFLREALKLRAKDTDDVVMLFHVLDRFQALAHTEAQVLRRDSSRRLEAGLLLREVKELWKVGLDLACAKELSSSLTAREEEEEEDINEKIKRTIERYTHTRETLEEMGLDHIWTLRPLLDGQAVITSLGIPKGPLVGQVMQAQIKWQIEHPEGGKDALVAHLQSLFVCS